MLTAWKKSKTLTEDLYRSPNTRDHATRIVVDETQAREILGPLSAGCPHNRGKR
jgi:hypothetical protein